MAGEKYYKQCTVYETLMLNRRLGPQLCIENTSVAIRTMTVKLVSTREGTGYDGEYSSGKKIVILGCVGAKLFVRYNVHHNYCYCMEYEIPFSVYLAVPSDVCEICCNQIEYTIEDVTALIMNSNQIFISVTILVEYLDEYVRADYEDCESEQSES